MMLGCVLPRNRIGLSTPIFQRTRKLRGHFRSPPTVSRLLEGSNLFLSPCSSCLYLDRSLKPPFSGDRSCSNSGLFLHQQTKPFRPLETPHGP
ncbi:hypothetical protein DVH24_036417 [Malus domestica]|uniref:Uncharacterized protein n=1 Tax=Malus domestica TaxID=3750 RepID=A0A498IFE4_MALDO|nr:hypothetical protein DVH24_036417 [Malus domestica]